MNYKKALLLAVLGVLTLTPLTTHALDIDTGSISVLCDFLPCSGGGGGAEGLSFYVFDKIVTAMEIIIVAVAVFALFTAARWQVMYASDETLTKDARTTYVYVIVGLAVVGLARQLVLAFSPTNTGGALVNTEVIDQSVGNVVTYFKLLIAVTLLVNIVVQAFRLITSQGEQDQVDKAKKRLIAGFIGAGVIMLANAIAVAALPGFGGSVIMAVEIAGIANYIIVIIGFLALIAIIIAGVLLIISIDEGLKDKAKAVIKTAIVALIVVLVSFALVTAFIAI